MSLSVPTSRHIHTALTNTYSPLKARIAIRDHWTPPTSAPGAALASIHKLLGLPVVCEPEWPLLVALLDAAYPDCEQLVLAVAGCVQAWCRAAGELFEAEGEWADEVLERIKDAPGSNGLRIFIEVCTSSWMR